MESLLGNSEVIYWTVGKTHLKTAEHSHSVWGDRGGRSAHIKPSGY